MRTELAATAVSMLAFSLWWFFYEQFPQLLAACTGAQLAYLTFMLRAHR